MECTMSMLAGMGLGAGLMYILDPQVGRRRRALVRDKAVSLAHEAQDAASVVARDMKNRAQGLTSGDLSVLVGGKQALKSGLRGSWSPTGRAVLTGLGTGLFLYGLTQHAPTACVMGTAGLLLALEGFTNAGIGDITQTAGNLADKARNVAGNLTEQAGNMADSLGIRQQVSELAHAARS